MDFIKSYFVARESESPNKERPSRSQATSPAQKTEIADRKMLSRASDAARDYDAKAKARQEHFSDATRGDRDMESAANDDQLSHDCDNIRAQISNRKDEREKLESKVMEKEQRLADIRGQTEAQQNIIDLFNVRQRELEKARHAIATSDIHAPVSIRGRIRSLNNKIEEIAFDATSLGSNPSSADLAGEPGMIRNILGPEYIPFLISQDSHAVRRSDMLKAILKIHLCLNVHQVLCSWNDGKFGQFLDQKVYYHIAHTEERGVAAKWREMALRELKVDCVTLDEKISSLSTSIFRILQFVGRVITSSDVEKLNSELRALIYESETIGRLMKTMSSCDIRPVIIPYGQRFEHLTMSDKSTEPDAWNWMFDWDIERLVLGTTEIGLSSYHHVEGQPRNINVGLKPVVVLLPSQKSCN